MINDLGFEGQTNNAGDLITTKRKMKLANEIHLKYVDDFSLAETINLAQQLIKLPVSERPQPDNFHSRTGHALELKNSRVFKKLEDTEKFAEMNKMKINHRKTKVIVFKGRVQKKVFH